MSLLLKIFTLLVEKIRRNFRLYNFYNLNKQIIRIKLGLEASKGFWTVRNPQFNNQTKDLYFVKFCKTYNGKISCPIKKAKLINQWSYKEST